MFFSMQNESGVLKKIHLWRFFFYAGLQQGFFGSGDFCALLWPLFLLTMTTSPSQ